MPIYEFTCERCAGRFEMLCRMGSNGEGLECPSCGCAKVRKVMSTFASRVSGGGSSPASASGSSCSACSSRNCASCH